MGKRVKAALQHEFGGFDQIEISSVELPDLGEGDVRIRIESAGVNPVDAGILKGHLKNGMPHNFPIIPGWDMSGTVEERGFAARRFDDGDKVYAYVRRPFVQWGTFSEEVVIPESYLAARPKNIKPVEAGAIPLAGLTAYQSLYEAGNLSEGGNGSDIGCFRRSRKYGYTAGENQRCSGVRHSKQQKPLLYGGTWS